MRKGAMHMDSHGEKPEWAGTALYSSIVIDLEPVTASISATFHQQRLDQNITTKTI